MSTNILDISYFDIEVSQTFVSHSERMISEKGYERNISLCGDEIKRLWELKLNNYDQTEIDYLWDFFIARRGRYDTFWFKNPQFYKISNEAVGIGNGTNTIFYLDYFPIDTSNTTIYLDDVEETGVTLENDTVNEQAKITFDSAPTLGAAITSTYNFYFQACFAEDKLSKEMFSYRFHNTGIKLIEVWWEAYKEIKIVMLDYVYKAQPFCYTNAYIDTELDTLDYAHEAQPFYGNSATI